MIRVADYVIKRIYDEGAKHIFYVVGRQCFYLTDAIRRSQEKDEIKGVPVHHEQTASMAALSYSLYNDEFGACLVTTGCGGTNAMTGILHAWQDSIPMIIISGQQEYENTIKASGLPLRQVGIQESDVESYARSMTKYAVTIDKAEDIAYHLDKAIMLAKSGRPGPVWLDIPMDIQNSMVNEDSLRRCDERIEKVVPKQDDIDYIIKSINEAERPVLLAGHGIRTSHSLENFLKFAKKSGIPVVFTRYANDMMDFYDPLNAGIIGASGCSRYGNFTVQNSDLVISFASKLSLEATGNREEFARAAKKIVIDIDKIEHSKKGIPIDRFVYGDVGLVVDSLNEYVNNIKDFDEWRKKCNHWKDIFDYTAEENTDENMLDIKLVYQRISAIAPEGTVYTCDAGLTGSTVDMHIRNHGSQRIITSYSQGEMGYALPAAIGVASSIDAPVVPCCGDGSIMMNIQELQTVVRNNYNMKIVIINNNGYSSIRHGQTQYFRGKTISSDPSNGLSLPDFEKLSEAFGIRYIRFKNYDDLNNYLPSMFDDNEPMVCEFMCDPYQTDLHNGLVSYGKRKYGFRPIEDQAPYIDRDLFFKEMIVDPLETSSGTPV